MKSFRSTGIMVALAAVLAGYTFYEFKKSADDAEIEQGDRRVFQLVRDDLEDIELTVKGATTILKKDKEGNSWKLVKPVEDLAESSAVEGFIYTLLTQKGKVFQADGEKNPKWADYGLESASSKVTIRGKGKSESLEVGKNAFDGSFYVRVGKELWLGDRGLAQLLERESTSFRSRKIYRGPEEVKQTEVVLDYEGMKDTYVFKKSDNKQQNIWTMEPDPGFPIDSFKVSLWIQKLTGLNGAGFVDEVPKGKPSMQVKLGGWTVTMSQDIGEEVFVTADKNPAFYKTGAASLDLVRVPKIYFRDGKIPFEFNLELVKEIDIESDKVKEAFTKKDSTWTMKRVSADMELDQDKLVTLIQSVQGLEVMEFVSAGFAPGAPQIVMKAADGKPVFTLAWGAEFKPKYGFNKGQTFRYVRVSTLKEIVGLPKDKLDRLIDSAIIKKKPQVDKTAAKTESKK